MRKNAAEGQGKRTFFRERLLLIDPAALMVIGRVVAVAAAARPLSRLISIPLAYSYCWKTTDVPHYVLLLANASTEK